MLHAMPDVQQCGSPKLRKGSVSRGANGRWHACPAAGSEEGAFFGGGSGGVALDEGYIPADTPERASPERPNGSLQCVSALMSGTV